LNLVLSFQATRTAPVAMMRQDRQGLIDRTPADHDDRVNAKAAPESELLHHKIDMLREQEDARLTAPIAWLVARREPPEDMPPAAPEGAWRVGCRGAVGGGSSPDMGLDRMKKAGRLVAGLAGVGRWVATGRGAPRRWLAGMSRVAQAGDPRGWPKRAGRAGGPSGRAERAGM
jgi:hypothetical protein